jgi:hypothetical protein
VIQLVKTLKSELPREKGRKKPTCDKGHTLGCIYDNELGLVYVEFNNQRENQGDIDNAQFKGQELRRQLLIKICRFMKNLTKDGG